MITITLMGQLQSTDGESELSCEVNDPLTVKQLIQRQGKSLREVFQLLKDNKLMITVNQRVASEDTSIQDGDTIKLVAHDGMGGSGFGPSFHS